MSTGRRGRSATAPRVIEILAWHPPKPGSARSDFDPTAPDWRQRGACSNADPDDFFPDAPGDPSEARALAACGACQVREQCLTFTIAAGEQHGVWGGLTEAQRDSLGWAPRAMPSLCPSGRHLLVDLGLTTDGRCRACRRETWREQDRASGSGLGHGRYIRTEDPKSKELAA
jgi:WhiB family transcriptional regulator, redox-sensing transcriptional regulator